MGEVLLQSIHYSKFSLAQVKSIFAASRVIRKLQERERGVLSASAIQMWVWPNTCCSNYAFGELRVYEISKYRVQLASALFTLPLLVLFCVQCALHLFLESDYLKRELRLRW